MRKPGAAEVGSALSFLIIAAIVVAVIVAIDRAAPDQSASTTPAVTPCQEPGSGSAGNPLMGSDVEHDPAGCDPAEGVDLHDQEANNAPSEGDSYRDSYDPGP